MNPANCFVRPGCLGDLARLRLAMDSERETLGHIPWPAFGSRLERGDVLVAVDGKSVLGYALLYFPKRQPAAPCQVHQVTVHPSARRRGIGRTLIDAASAAAVLGGRQIVQAWCRIDLPASCFWRSLDFDPVGVRPGGAKRRHPLILWRNALSAVTRQNGVYWQLPSRAGAASCLDTPMRHIDADEALRIMMAPAPALADVLRSLRCDRPGKSVRSRS